MCITNVIKVKVTSPITVYKVVIKNLCYKKTICYTPFRGALLTDDILSGKELFIAERPYYNPYNYAEEHGELKIGAGYIHAYSNMEDAAVEYFEYYVHNDTERYETMIYECEIPVSEAEHYCWKGVFDRSRYECMAAREMKFKRLVTIEELKDAYDRYIARRRYCPQTTKMI